MEILDFLVHIVIDHPILALIGLASIAILVVLLKPKTSSRARHLQGRIQGIQRRFILAVEDRRLASGGALHDLMARALRQWPHAPLAFYQGVLMAADEIADNPKPLDEWDEAAVDPTVQELAADFTHLVNAISYVTKPSLIVPRSMERDFVRIRQGHLKREAR